MKDTIEVEPIRAVPQPLPKRSRHISRWHLHPAFKDHQSTFGERAADRMKALFATWAALFTILIVMALWMVTNGLGSDPRPWIELNLCLSCIAGLQCFIILIAAKRQDQIAYRVALHTAEMADQILKEVRGIREETSGDNH